MSHPGSGVEAVTFRARKSSLATVFVSVVAALFVFGAAPASAATLQVSTSGADSGNCVESECLTVQYAVSQAVDGDTISIGSGTFEGAFTVNKRLTIGGAGNSTVLTASTGNLAVLAAGSSQSELKDLKLVGAGAASGIRTDVASTGVRITDVEVTGFNSYAVAIHNNGAITDWVLDGLNSHENQHGMRIRGSAQGLTVSNSHFDDNTSHGFFAPVDGGTLDDITVTDSTFNGNGDKAFYLERGTNITLERVEASDTGGGSHVSPHAIEFNLKQGASAGPVSVIDSVVDGSPGGGIVIRGGVSAPSVTAATITGNVVSNSLVGLGFENQVDLANVTVSGNQFRDNTVGLANSVETGTLILADDNQFSGNSESDIDGDGTTVILPKVTVPAIAGTGTVGETITCTAGIGTGFPEPVVSNEMLLEGTPISGAGLTYTPVAGDVGKAVSCRSTATNAGGNDARTSASITVVAAPEPPAPEPPKPDPPTVEPVKKQITVPNNGTVVAMTISCPEGNCKVNAPKKVKVKIGGKVFYATVKVQKNIKEGQEAKVRLVLPKNARKAIKGKQTKTQLKLTVVSSDGSKKTVKQTVKLKGKRR